MNNLSLNHHCAAQFPLSEVEITPGDVVFNGNVFMIQVRALCEKAKEILMDESNVQVLYLFMLICSVIRVRSANFYMPSLC